MSEIIFTFLIIVLALIYFIFYIKKNKNKILQERKQKQKDYEITNQIDYEKVLYKKIENNTKIIENDKIGMNGKPQNELYSAEVITSYNNYINYIVNPIPTYEEIAQDLKIERPIPSSNFIYNDLEKTDVIISPSVPVNNVNNASTTVNNTRINTTSSSALPSYSEAITSIPNAVTIPVIDSKD